MGEEHLESIESLESFADTETVVDFLLSVLKEEIPDCENSENFLKFALFKQELNSLVADALYNRIEDSVGKTFCPREGSGMMRKTPDEALVLLKGYRDSQTLKERETGKSDEELLTTLIGEENIEAFYNNPDYKEFHNTLKDKTDTDLVDMVQGIYRKLMLQESYTSVSTGHPTEFLSPDAKKIFGELRNTIFTLPIEKLGYKVFIPNNPPENLDAALEKTAQRVAKVRRSIKPALSGHIKEFWEKLEPPTSKMTTKEEIAHSINLHGRNSYDAIPRLIQRLHTIETDFRELHLEKEDIKTREFASIEELDSLSTILRNHTWLGGDRDSKPKTTAQAMLASAEMNKEAIQNWYDEDISSLIDEMDTSTQQGKKAKEDLIELRGVLRTLNLNDKNLNSQYQEIIESLKQIKADADSCFPPQLGEHGEETGYSALDVLYVKMKTYASTIQTIEVRENKEMHDKVLPSVVKVLKEAGIEFGDIDTSNTEDLIDFIHSGDNNKAVYNAITEKLKLIEKGTPEFTDFDAYAKAYNELSEAGESEEVLSEMQDTFDLYQTLAGAKVAVDNPDSFKEYIIAENESSDDMLKVFLLTSMVTHPDKENNLDITSLSESLGAVEKAGISNVEALKNKHFFKHQKRIGEKTYKDKLEIWDPRVGENGGYRPLTVADEKIRHGVEPKEGDEKRIIEMCKPAMTAGSDFFRGDGIGSVGLAMQLQRKIGLDMLDAEPPVRYIPYQGNGSAYYRNNPIAACWQTVQGLEMRTLGVHGVVSRYMLNFATSAQRMISTILDPERLVVRHERAALQSGNLLGLPLLTEEKKDSLESRLRKACDSYNEMLGSDVFKKSFGSSTAVYYTKLFNLSARPNNRVGAKKQDGAYPQEVNPKKLRAIGYGLSLGESGSNIAAHYSFDKIVGLQEGQEKLTEEQIEEQAQLLTESPELQSTTVKAIMAIGGADLDAAWRFAGYQRFEENGEIYVRKLDEDLKPTGKEISAEEIKKHAEKFKKAVEGGEKIEETEENCIIMASMQEVEHNRNGEALLAILEKRLEIENKVTGQNIVEGSLRERLLAIVNSEFAEALENGWDAVVEARKTLADDHLNMINKPDEYPPISLDITDPVQKERLRKLYFAHALVIGREGVGERIPPSLIKPVVAGIVASSKDFVCEIFARVETSTIERFEELVSSSCDRETQVCQP